MSSDAVELSWHEVAMASEIGRLRQLSAVKNGLTDRHGYDGVGWTEHIEGACGEMAVAKALNIYWNGSVDTFSAHDLPGLQVRTRSKHDYELIVRKGDSDEACWVLVTGKAPRYLVHGWIRGRDAKQAKWWEAHGGRPAAYFVPQCSLRPISTLVVTDAKVGA